MTAGFRLSPQQRHVWRSQAALAGAALRVSAAWRVEGPLEAARLRWAVEQVVSRHEVLRTRFVRLPGVPEPLQAVAAEAGVEWREEAVSEEMVREEDDRAGRPAAGGGGAVVGGALDGALAARLARLAAAPWDAAEGPVLRVVLLRVGEGGGRHGLLASLPAVCGDAVSLDLLIGDAVAFYAASFPGREEAGEPERPEIMQCADFAAWHLAHLAEEESAEGRAWWASRDLAALAAPLPWEDGGGAGTAGGEPVGMAGSPPGLPSVQEDDEVGDASGEAGAAGGESSAVGAGVDRGGGFRRAFVRLPLAAADWRAIGDLCAAEGSSPELFLLACWQALLLRAGGRDPAVAVSLDGRKFTELEAALGPYTACLPVVAGLSGEMSFGAALAAVSAALVAAYEQLESFSWEQAAGQIAGGLGETQGEQGLHGLHHPDGEPYPAALFEHEARPAAVRAGEVAFVPVAKRSLGERFRLKLATLNGPDGWAAEVWHDAARISAAAAARVAEELATLARAALADPAAPLGELDIVGPAERRLLAALAAEGNLNVGAELASARGGASPLTAGPSGLAGLVHHWIFAQALRSPARIAVEAQGRTLTYGALAALADRLARQLRGLGVGPEVPVALLLDRSPETVAAILGVLAAGGAYVPLDPASPPERLAAVLETSRAPLLLTRERLAGRLGERAPDSIRVLFLDGVAGLLAPPDPAPPDPLATADVLPDQLAYVLFTSGSTGQPKGVEVSHRNLALSTAARFASYAAPVRRYLLASPFAFDSSVAGIFWTLSQGGTLVLPDDEMQADLAGFVRDLEARAVSHLLGLPGLWRVVLEQGDPARLADLRTVIVAGKACPRDLVEMHRERLPWAGLFNEYGPTEATVWSTVHDCSRPWRGVRVPIGRPVGNTRVHVLDSRLLPLPLGAAGELCVGGGGVARGYRGRGDLTAERFVPDPAGGGDRLYRTGDLCRFLPDGSLDFLGRVDHQVKIRGFRIELGEIESALRRHPAVRDAVVVALDGAGDRQLVAYVVPVAEAPAGEELRRFLRAALPEIMVPAAWVALAELPRNPNGKVDRRALPAPGAVRPEDDPRFVAPRTPAEEVLAEIWAGVLSRAAVGVESDFFDLGGNSLLATQLVARVRAAFRVEVPQRSLFQHPTVAAFGAAVEELRRAGEPRLAPLTPLDSVRRAETGPAPLSLGQERIWLAEQLHPGSNAFNLIYPVHFTGPLAPAALGAAIDEIARRHQVLRARFRQLAGEARMEIGPAGRQPLAVADLAALPAAPRAAEVERLAARLQEVPFDLAAGRLLRNVLVRLAPLEHRLLLVLHQIVFDGWSLGVLGREFAALYRAAVEGRPSPLPEPPLQYADFARWQRGWMAGDMLAAEADWWRGLLGERPGVAEIPPDRPRLAGQASAVSQVWVELPPAVGGELRAAARREGATPFMFVLALLHTLIHRATGAGRTAVGTLVANRDQPGIDGLLGFFVNTLALPADFAGEPTFGELLARVRAAALGATDHQDLPFEKVIEAVHPRRTGRGQALFQVMYAFQNAPLARLDLPGVAMTFPRAGAGARTAAFDLSWTAMEEEGALAVVLEYDRDLYEAATAHRLAATFEGLLRAAVADPARPIQALLPLSDEERAQLARAAAPPAAEPAAGSAGVAAETPAAPVERAAAGRAEVEDLRAQLSDRRQELLARRLGRDRRAVAEARPPAIPRRAPGLPAPLSFGQERLWVLDRLDPGSDAYNLLDVVLLRGEIDPAALGAALGEVRRRHEVLRTVIVEREGEPVQEVIPLPAGDGASHLPVVDLAALPGIRRRGGGAGPRARRGAAPVRSRRRTAPARHPAAAGGAGAPADPGDAPHRLRRLVVRGAAARAGDPLPVVA